MNEYKPSNDLERDNYIELLEWGARWNTPQGILERLQKLANQTARRGRKAINVKPKTMVRAILGHAGYDKWNAERGGG